MERSTIDLRAVIEGAHSMLLSAGSGIRTHAGYMGLTSLTAACVVAALADGRLVAVPVAVAAGVVAVVFGRRRAREREEGVRDMVQQFKAYADTPDRAAFRLVRHWMAAHGVDGPTTSSPREQRRGALQQMLGEALSDREVMVERGHVCLQTTVPAVQMLVGAGAVARGLAPRRQRQIALDLHAVGRTAAAWQRQLERCVRHYEQHPKAALPMATRTSAVAAWAAYEASRTRLSRHVRADWGIVPDA